MRSQARSLTANEAIEHGAAKSGGNRSVCLAKRALGRSVPNLAF